MGRRRKVNVRRIIPVLRISLNKANDYIKICEVPEFKDLIMNETLFAIKDGVEKKKKNILLFEIGDSRQCINIDREEWKDSLNSVMNYFSEKEDYNKAIECRELLKQI